MKAWLSRIVHMCGAQNRRALLSVFHKTTNICKIYGEEMGAFNIRA